MVPTGIQNKLPGNVLGYLMFSRVIVAIIFIAIGFGVMFLDIITGTITIIPALVIMLIGVAVLLWSIFWYVTFSFTVTDQNITINSGVLFRRSRTIDFNKIQNINNTRGPVQAMFGLSGVNIQTVSQAVARPAGKIYLLQQDADDLKSYIASKGPVAPVRGV